MNVLFSSLLYFHPITAKLQNFTWKSFCIYSVISGAWIFYSMVEVWGDDAMVILIILRTVIKLLTSFGKT